MAHEGRLGIELLSLDGILCPQDPIALQIEPCVLQQSLVARHLTFHLGQLRFEWSRIDLRQQVPLLDDLTFHKLDVHQLSVDAAVDGDGIEGGNRSKTGEINADVARLRGYGHYRHGTCERVSSLFGGTWLRLAGPCQ